MHHRFDITSTLLSKAHIPTYSIDEGNTTVPKRQRLKAFSPIVCKEDGNTATGV